jgi:hypothetical protein
VRLQSPRNSSIQAPRTRHFVSFFTAILVMAMVAPQFPSTAMGATASNDIYLAQNSAGAGGGTDCADAMPVSFFNSSANWGSGGNQIGPGTTVHLCGTITTALSFQGSGASGNPVVLDGTGATMSAYIDTAKQYWTIQNITWSTSYATNSATQAIIQVQGGAAFGTIQNNHIDILNSAQAVFLAHICHDITIQNNYLRVTTVPGDGFDTDVLDTEGSYNVLVQGNLLALNIGAGDANCGGCHDDVTQVWAASGSAANDPYNWTYRYNILIQESAVTNNLSLMMFEAIGAGYWDVYGNVFVYQSGGSSGNGINWGADASGMNAHIFNNTIVAYPGAGNNLIAVNGSGTYGLENNITYNASSGTTYAGNNGTYQPNAYNLWYGNNAPSCSGFTGDICGQDPLFADLSGQNFSLQSGSPAVGTGTNLGAPYNTGIAPGARWPNPALVTRPSSGNWDLGAFQSGSVANQPAPPAALTALVN